MRVHPNYIRRDTGERAFTRWGIFGNVWPTKSNRLDRETVGTYLHIHTPWFVFHVIP